MPLTAEARPKEEATEYHLIDITCYEAPRLELSTFELRCPDCQSPMHVRQSLVCIPHFVHNPTREGRNCSLSSGESIRHLVCKAEISKRLLSVRGYEGATITKEVWLPEIQRRADLLVVHADCSREVHEVQLASITIDELEDRTRDYQSAGANVIWWFGGKADTQSNREWANSRLGGYGFLHITDGQIRVI